MAGRLQGRGLTLRPTPMTVFTYHAQVRLVAGGAIGADMRRPSPAGRLALTEGLSEPLGSPAKTWVCKLQHGRRGGVGCPSLFFGFLRILRQSEW
jgi:hypothetical protein